MDYKDTLLMPNTEFEMRGNLGKREPLFQKKWDEINLYEEVLKKNKDNKPFVLHDGPPYANGNIHIGHAMNKILKDFVIRYKTMQGFYTPYIPGWDTHGLPIETALTKSGVNRKEMSVAAFREKCYAYAIEQVSKQSAQFQRLGVLGDFKHPYTTLEKSFEAEQIKVFAKMAMKGLIYKGLKPVYWSPSSESALAEAEIEYADRKDPSIFIKMQVVDGQGKLPSDAYFLVWTTTPWTIPGNLAICAGPDITYVLAQCGNEKLIFAEDLQETLTQELNLDDVKVLSKIKGIELEGMTYKHPLYDRVSPLIYGEHVTTTDGTGLVHTAPGHGEDDFIVGKAFGLEVLCPVDEKGCMTKEAGQFEGLFYDDCNKAVIEALEKENALKKLKYITHSYPHDWRTKKPVIFRATAQWFASIDMIKEDLLKEVKGVKWFPKWGELRISNMIKDRQEWCISRQRAWGVPIPVFYAEDGTEILDQKIFEHIANLFGESGSNIWFEKEAKDLLPKGYTNPHSPNGVFRKETDIMDVWFDSGSSHQAVLNPRGLNYPADMYLEGADQYRGWFNSSLITAVSISGKSPYREVVTHGFVLDGEGRKMSKSLGNTVDPLKVIDQMGADILRLWVSSIEYNSDVRISQEMLKQVSEAYRKIRNTIRFMLGNISDFDPEKDYQPFESLDSVDQFILIKNNQLIKDCYSSFDVYQFNEVYRLINNYISNLLSPFYLDFTKDILYIEGKKAKSRLNVQTVYYEVLTTLLKLLTPILPHTTSEAYDYLPGKKEKDVYLENMPKVKDYTKYNDCLEKFNKFMIFRDEILKALEDARNEKIIGKSFNAHLHIYPSNEIKELLEGLNANIGQIMIVSKYTLEAVQSETKIVVEAAQGDTCARCWQIVDHVDENGLCDRCREVLK